MKFVHSTNINDETYFEILESKLISEITIKVEDLSQYSYTEIKHIGSCNFYYFKRSKSSNIRYVK